MSEALTPSIHEIEASMHALGYNGNSRLVQTYPLYHRDRQVFRVHEENGSDVVIKIRKSDEGAIREAGRITKLVASYRYSGGHFPTVFQKEFGGKTAVRMPFLGHSLSELGQLMDLTEFGYPPTEGDLPFTGLHPEEIEVLIERLRHSHLNFAEKERLIHGDLKHQGRSPTNVVYKPDSRILYLVDGEALSPLTDETLTRFNDQLDDVKEWMYASLEII